MTTWRYDGTRLSADSLGYYRDYQHELGRIVDATVSFPGLGEDEPYTLVLRDDCGGRLMLSGAAAGYPGEGPRIAMQMLIEAGFTAEIARTGFTHRLLRLTRGSDGATLVVEASGWRPASSCVGVISTDRA